MPPSTAGASNSGARTAKSDGVSTSITGDKTRDKCIEMLYDAFALESGFRMSSLSSLATLIGSAYIILKRPTSYCNVPV
jgi:transcription elongation factor S-II